MPADGEGRGRQAARSPYPLRVHQQQALEAVEKVIADGGKRAWVVLPPGAGKTLVGLETARRRGRKTVVFGPNTAIQSQWLRGWRGLVAQSPDPASLLPTPTPPAPIPRQRTTAGTRRDLDQFFTSLTYQSLATFRPDNEVDEEGSQRSPLARLHVNGQALVEQLRREQDLTLVLDECHHLLDVWGRLLKEVLDELPNAFVLGLTATPPEALTRTEEELVDDLFGPITFSASIPAVVRAGDLAPFAELAWLTAPTPGENDWLRSQATRFQELVTQLTDPQFGSVPFLDWIDRRFVQQTGDALSWHRLARDEPELCDAALRMVHHGLLQTPYGARLREQHRHPPSADDWVLLVEDWMLRCLTKTGSPSDHEVVEAVRRALPSVGYQWTRRGIRKGRSTVDRVLARSEAKTHAAVEIVQAEHRTLQDRLRMLVLCDHEYASAVLPADLAGVIPEQAGSAHLALEQLVAGVPHLNPMLVTGGTVAGSPTTLQRFVEFLREHDPHLAGNLSVAWPNAEITQIVGPWRSRNWVPWVTRFFQDGHSQVLVGTRALLGEGWDARSVTGLVDLTAATTATSVVQTRGRALRLDPGWPEKVAVTWTVVCVSADHPKGANDWQRFVRKHDGFYGIDADGDVVSGVAHVDPLFSPFAPPPPDRFDLVNARMALRAEQRARIRDAWQVGEGYDDTVVHTVRVREARRVSAAGPPPPQEPGPSHVVARDRGLDVRDDRPAPWRPHPVAAALFVLSVVTWLLEIVPDGVNAVALAIAVALQTVVAAGRGRALVDEAARPPSLVQVASAVADALHVSGLSPAGAEAVRVLPDAEGEYRCFLDGVDPAVSATFANAFDEVVSPMAAPRYVLPRWVVTPPTSAFRGYAAGLAAAVGLLRPNGEVWHSVPAVLGVNAERAQAFARAWDTWVGGGPAVYTGSPEGEGVLATHRGSDPFALTTVLRAHWR